MTNERTLGPGGYSAGTLRDSDIVDMFDTIGLIVNCGKCRDDALALFVLLARIDALPPGAEVVDSIRAEVSELFAELYGHVGDAHTPEGYYFGAHCGDGACFGVWPTDDDDFWDGRNVV